MIRSSIDEARDFLENAHRIAVVGVSREPRDFTRFVFRELASRGLHVVPVNPALGQADGVPAFARVQDVQPSPDLALLMVPAARADEAVRDCLVARVRRIWFHRGAGPGAGSPTALALCRANRIEVVQGLCPLLALPSASFPHRLHGLFRSALGQHP